MEEKRNHHPMIYLLLMPNKERKISGYFTNAQMSELYLFQDFEDLIMQVMPLIKEDIYFRKPMAQPRDIDWVNLPTHRRLFIIEICYQQNKEWQGIILGTGHTHVRFKNRNDIRWKLIRKINLQRNL